MWRDYTALDRPNSLPDIIAFQGIRGANSDLAIHQHFGDQIAVHPCSDLDMLFAAVRDGTARYALVPIENSFAGAVSGAYELLMNADYRIQAEVILHVHHALVAMPGKKINDLRAVRSHPQALAQCERYLQRHNLAPIAWYDTAGAAKDLIEQASADVGAIATTIAAELYGLEVLDEQIEDDPYNYTRFFVIGNEDPPRGDYNKTSLVFATRNRPAALYDCLGEFATRGLNLTKIESRPRRTRPWEPMFYLDFEGHWQDTACQEALTRLLQKASFVKMLGSYPAVKTDTIGM